MDFASSFRATGQNAFAAHQTPQTMFKALRRLHGQNLESRGLNDMSEAFQSFVTRARFFSVGKLRRTWSHSAAEFIKYRRLLPMLLADGQQFNSAETDDFDASLANYAKSKEQRKIIVTNISPRVTSSQLQAFFSKFGKVSHCSLPREDRRLSMFGTIPKNLKNCGMATLTFKKAEDAERAKNATPEELKFYEQCMVVAPYVSKRKGGKGVVLADDSRGLNLIDLRGCRRLHGRCFQLFGEQLEQLYLDGCVHVDERAFEDLCTFAAGLKELRINDCYQITDENLSMISRMMSDLRVFTLCGDRFEKLSPAGMAHISNMKALSELALDYNPLVDDKFLISICGELKNLKTLSLANAGTDQTLTAKGLTAIAQLESLEQIDLSSLAALRSGILLEIVYSCKSISLLQLRNCTYLSDDGVKGLTRVKHLRHVDLSGSILITNDSIQEFIKAFPQGKDENGSVTIVVGGTAADSSRLSVRGSRVVVDLSDYTSILSMSNRQPHSFRISTLSDDELSDDDFENLTSQRSFYIDAVCGEEESPIEDENELRQWAEREARNLGLLDK
ncbi:Leucine Rich repeat-containing domain protein [Trichostrongylus colubriformis]|uniref:Leucine Rich repeat-containing domain protein n=1 Tax=Trichostrongylus colubriformis TaxID=6319 RepID=A0AAN8ILC3_TRICO